MRNQPRSRINTTHRNPQSQMLRIAIGIQSAECVSGAEGTSEGLSVNGWAICCIASETYGGASFVAIWLVAIALQGPLPRSISSANGTRNLTDAISHKQ